MKLLKLPILVVALFVGTLAATSAFASPTPNIIHCAGDQGLVVNIAYSSEVGTTVAQITRRVIAAGFAHPQSIILLKSATPVVEHQISGDDQIWYGKGIRMDISITHLFPQGKDRHVTELQATLNNGQKLREQVGCNFLAALN